MGKTYRNCCNPETLALGDGGDYTYYGTFSPVSGNGTITNGADDSTVTVRSYNSEYNNLPLVIGNGYHYNGCTGVYDQMVIESKYKCEDADCQNYAWYWYSCACGQKGTDSFEDEEGGCIDHNLIIVGDTPTQHIYQCSMCLKDYADYILTHTGYSAETIALGKSMLNYGAYSQTYFGYNTENLANAGLEEADKALPAITADNLSAYAGSYTKDKNYNGSTTYYGSSLVLNSGTDIKHYFTYDPSIDIDLYYCADNYIATSGDYLYVRCDNIPAHNLGKVLTLRLVENGEIVGKIQYSPLSYAYEVLKIYPDANSENEKIRNVVIALYDYYTKANAYIAV